MIKGVSVEKQIAIVLYKLATCTDYSIMSGMFGVNKLTVHKIFYKMILSINKHLLCKIICTPDKEEAQDIAQHYKEVYGVPQILGAIEFTHVPLSVSLRTLSIFINPMNYPSCVLQAVVDPHHCFRDISVKCPGNTKSRLILENSNLFKYINHVIPSEVNNINGINVPYKIVGNLSYPLLWWLLTKYTDLLTRKEILFNECLDKILSSTNEAIAKLKARFIILSQSIDVSFKMAPQVISACCAIHNICERNGDTFLQDWLNAAEQFSEKFPQPDKTINKDQADKVILEQRNTIRDYIEGQMLTDNTELNLIKKEIVDLLNNLT